MPRARWLAFALSLGTLLPAALIAAKAIRAEVTDSHLLEADRLWGTRAEHLEGRLAVAERTEQALAAYLAGIETQTFVAATLEPRWKALRAAHYLSEFTTATRDRGDLAIASATQLADASLVALARSAGTESLSDFSKARLESWLEDTALDRYDVAQLHFWSAIVWGAQGQRVGFLTIVRQGIARRIYDNARLAIRIDPAIERGGALRLLSRLHADLPRVPFVSGWVDRKKVLPQAERAFGIDPDDPGNRVILALALRDRVPSRRDRIESLLESVVAREPRAELLAEDLAIREQAAELLVALKATDD